MECNIPEEARAFKPLDPVTEQMGHNVADFLVSDLKKGHIPPQFLPLQSGVGVTSNAVLEALGQNPNVPVFSVYTEVVQDAVVKYMREGRIKDASCSSLTVTNDTLQEVYDDIDYFKQHLTIRQSEISNSPEVIRRLGVIAMNTAIECDIYGNENSSHICGSKWIVRSMMWMSLLPSRALPTSVARVLCVVPRKSSRTVLTQIIVRCFVNI